MIAATSRWDIFCKVVDNFGDAGVSWRLARLLAAEHGIDVTLWIDELAALAPLEPSIAPDRDEQRVREVTVRRRTDALSSPPPADVVIDAFGGGVPEAYVAAMAGLEPPPDWFILEYLSAEAWVESAHGRASPHPRLPLARRFWFPGFTAKTGGLLRERGLFARRDEFRSSAAARSAFWASLGVPPPASNEIRVSLFCYPDAPLAELMDAWAAGGETVVAVIPGGVAAPIARGRLSLVSIPFLAQDDYDRLLWACDVNFVRGEDSLVRAQWAARPFVWQPYAQSEGAHHAKRAALLDRYAAGLDAATAQSLARFWAAWNRDPAAPAIADAWRAFVAVRARLAALASTWAEHLAALPELAAGLVRSTHHLV
jgi:uncharacterized repeat protein (TIGR03837 family)